MARNARPRWLMDAFSIPDISAKVRPGAEASPTGSSGTNTGS